jgi:hypothetical protein
MKELFAPGQNAQTVLEDSLGTDPFAMIADLEEAGKRKAKAAGQAYQLENHRKILLSRIAGELSQVHKGLAENKLERMARADPRYEAHIKGTAAAIEEKEHAESAYWTIRARLEWLERAIAHSNALTRLEK